MQRETDPLEGPGLGLQLKGFVVVHLRDWNSEESNTLWLYLYD